MTAIFAYVDKKRGVAFVGADDRETPVPGGKPQSHKPCDKVFVLHDRFIVASLGLSAAGAAARCVGYLAGLPTEFGDGTKTSATLDIRALCGLVASVLSRSIGPRAWEALCNESAEANAMNTKLVIMDATASKLALADFGKVGPRGTHYCADIRDDFEPNLLWRFGVDVPVPFSLSGTTDPSMAWCRDYMARARQEAAEHGEPDAVGDLGAWAMWADGRMKIRTIHNSLSELVDSLFREVPTGG